MFHHLWFMQYCTVHKTNTFSRAIILEGNARIRTLRVSFRPTTGARLLRHRPFGQHAVRPLFLALSARSPRPRPRRRALAKAMTLAPRATFEDDPA